LLDYDKEFQA
jgi:zinc transporter 2